jgi:hypothetical protein
MKIEKIDGKTTPIAYAEGILRLWDARKREWKSVKTSVPYTPAWASSNDRFFDADPERANFVYGMAKAECKTYNLPDDKAALAAMYIEDLRTFDPHHVYVLMPNMIIKERRLPEELTGEAAEAETEWLNNSKHLPLEQRLTGAKILDDYKKNLFNFDV